MSKIKTCYCRKCGKWVHYLGITSHRAMHRRRREDVTIEYTSGRVVTHKFSQGESR